MSEENFQPRRTMTGAVFNHNRMAPTSQHTMGGTKEVGAGAGSDKKRAE